MSAEPPSVETQIARLLQRELTLRIRASLHEDDAVEIAEAILAMPTLREWHEAWWREESWSSIYDGDER